MPATYTEADLFSSDPSLPRRALSPRAAFQAALHGRLSILDLRTSRERAREGEVPGYLSQPRTDHHCPVVALAGADGATLGLPAIDGGFRAWRAAGMPVATT